MADAKKKYVAIIAGVGPGLGAALVRKLASEDCSIGMFARSPELIGELATEIGTDALAIPTDISNPKQVAAAFRNVRQQRAPVDILIPNASGAIGKGVMETAQERLAQA